MKILHSHHLGHPIATTVTVTPKNPICILITLDSEGCIGASSIIQLLLIEMSFHSFTLNAVVVLTDNFRQFVMLIISRGPPLYILGPVHMGCCEFSSLKCSFAFNVISRCLYVMQYSSCALNLILLLIV